MTETLKSTYETVWGSKEVWQNGALRRASNAMVFSGLVTKQDDLFCRTLQCFGTVPLLIGSFFK